MDPILHEQFVDIEIEKAYSNLRNILLERDCKIVSEEPPKHITVEHGSLRGVSPMSAKKVVSYHNCPYESGTRIAVYSSVSSDWAKLTLWGNIIAGLVAMVFWWIATDIVAFIVNGTTGYWTWLAEAFGYPDIGYVFFMTNVTKALSIVLFITIVLEILDVIIVYRKIDTFALEILDELVQK